MSRTALVVRYVLWLWFFGAIAAGYFLPLQRIPAPAILAVIFTLTGLLLSAYVRIAPLRTWVDSLDPLALVQLHLTRFVGFYFLFLYREGELPHGFAVTGGVGDIVVATFAAVLLFVPFAEPRLHRLLNMWNVIGLIDLVFVLFTAARLNLADPSQLRALTYLPLSLLPTFLVPLLLATHVILFLRLNQKP